MTKMFLIPAAAAAVMMLTACAQPANDAMEAPILGGDRDAHGCIPSAGFSWSALLERCVQPFEAGIRLNPAEPPKTGAVISAFAILRDDAAEVFLPTEEGTAILAREEDGWTDGRLNLRRIDGKLVLTLPGGAAYREE